MFQENITDISQNMKKKSSNVFNQLTKHLFKDKSNNNTLVYNIEASSSQDHNKTIIPLEELTKCKFTNKSNYTTFVYNARPCKIPREAKRVIVIKDDREYFLHQYAKIIGTPLRPDRNINLDLKKLIRKKRFRGRSYSEPVNPKTEARLLYWPELPFIKKCLCKEDNCICTGCRLAPCAPVPYATKQNKMPAGTLIGSLESALSEAVDAYKITIEDETMDLKCAEFCGARCLSFKYGEPLSEPMEAKISMIIEKHSEVLKKNRIQRQIKFEEEHADDFEIREPEEPKKKGKKANVKVHMINEIEIKGHVKDNGGEQSQKRTEVTGKKAEEIYTVKEELV